jgi:NADPH:quinone reductase-like Zn-dependent oxidoreductase
MKAAVITRSGAPDVLKVQDWPDPEPDAGQVRVRTRFSGVNFADIAARVGIYPDAPKPPCVIGYEVSGTIDKLGDGVDNLHIGDRVFGMTMFGGYAELACLPAAAVRRIPEGMSDEEAAALPVNYVTAYHMLCYLTTVRAQDRVLVHAAAGGVGIAAIQICRAAGAEIFGTASAGKHDFLRSIGVTHCIDYRTEDFEQSVHKLTGGQGVDIVLDALGGSALKKSYNVLRPAGRLFTFGFSRATQGETRQLFSIISEFLKMPRFHSLKLMDKNRAVLGVNMNHMAERPELMGREFDGLVDLFQNGVIRPRVDKVFPLAEAGAAHRFLQERRNIGKVLLQVA